MRKWFTCLTYLLLLTGMLAGCKRIELYELTTKVKINFDIDLDIDVDLDMEVDTKLDPEFAAKVDGVMPEYMQVIFYDSKTNRMQASFILPASGGEVDIRPGDYHIVAYNFGTNSTQTDYVSVMDDALAFTTDITKSMASKLNAQTARETRGYEDDPIIYEPDHLYVANEKNINVPSVLNYNEDVTIYSTASTILDVYSLEVLGVTGCENIEKVEAFITGHIKNNRFGIEERGTDPATLYVTLKPDAQNNRLYTVFGTFGKLPFAENKVYLDITITDTGGGQYRYVYDVTDQFDDEKNVNNKLVIIEEIDIPEGNIGGGGLAPGVQDWDDESVDIPLC